MHDDGVDSRDHWPRPSLHFPCPLVTCRQFVFAPESRQRLRELALVAGAILMYSAAMPPAVSTGFWDRTPQPTAGRLRRVLCSAGYKDTSAQRQGWTLLTISDESHSPRCFFCLSHKIISPEDVRGMRCTVHSLSLGKAIINGYTKEDTYGNRHPAARLV